MRQGMVPRTVRQDGIVLGPRLRQSVVAGFKGLVPLVDYLCAALDLEF